MDALSIIRGYGCSDSEDEEFRGFDGISDYFPGAQFWAKEEQVAGRGFRSYGDGRSTVEQDAGATFRNHERSAAEQAAGPSFRSYEGSVVGQVAGSSFRDTTARWWTRLPAQASGATTARWWSRLPAQASGATKARLSCLKSSEKSRSSGHESYRFLPAQDRCHAVRETEGEVGGKLVYMLAEPERKRSRAADGDGQAMPCSDALPGMTDHQGHASPRKLPHRLPTAYAPAPAPEDMVKFNLERCNLALLHQQNTGRLFIVLFEKKKKLLSEVFRCRFLTWA
ncbi:hypothetical protein quinque_013614 [Culex quinquefasciatus]